jgi:putative MFS transporter
MSDKEINKLNQKITENDQTENETFEIIHDDKSNLINENSDLVAEVEGKSEEVNLIINEMGMSPYLIKVLIFGILTCFADGSEMVVVSLIMRRLETKWNLTPIKKASLGGSIFYGFLFGSLLSGKVMDKNGRKYTLVLGSIIFFIFGMASSFATEFYSFFAFRIGVGFGVGFLVPTMQTYLTEFSPQAYRGFISIIIWIGFPLGEMYICYISHLFPLDDQTYHQSNWKIIMFLAGIPVIYILIY